MVAAAPLAAEKLELIQDAIAAVSGDRPTYQACLRWMNSGLLDKHGNRVRLEFEKCGRRRKTSRQAVRRFFAQLTASYQDNGSDSAAVRAVGGDHAREDSYLAAELG